jgi:predicted O-linked N-acetylglucosamine transferase (SPINDLY family)
MGMPIVAVDDPQHGSAGSSTAATLRGVQLGECVADSLDGYRQLASQWITDPSMIDRLRERCRPALAGSALMDHTARVAEVERAYRFMWNAHVDTAVANEMKAVTV